MATHYRILFTGRLLPGKFVRDVLPELMHQFQLSETAARQLIEDGKRRVIKHEVAADEAERYRLALTGAGLEIILEPLPDAAETPPPAQASARPTPAPNPTPMPLTKSPASPGWSDTPADAPDATACRAVGLGRGAGWIGDGWRLFREQPGTWIGALLIYLLLVMGTNLIPLIGPLAAIPLTPMLVGGLMLGAHRQMQGTPFSLEGLFAGFRECPLALALIGVLQLLAMLATLLLIGLITLVFVGILANGMNLDLAAREMPDMMLSPLPWVLMLVGLAIFIPVILAFLFAPPLVAIDRLPLLRAMGLSLRGSLRNLLPLTLFGLLATLLFILGTIPLLLGLLVVMPLLTLAFYAAYRDIFAMAGGQR